MSADTVASVEDVMRFLLDLDDGACARIERPSSVDLTDALLAKANQRAAAGARVLVVCADTVAERRYLDRLPAYPALDAAAVSTMERVALRVAALDGVRAATNRDPRILDANELDVLMEDMKVSGLKPRRLREMLKFFYKGLSEYANEQDDWLINYEEQHLFAMLSENMEVRRAMLPFEASALAYRGMVEAGVERESLMVLVDDYGTLSKASQRLIEHLATDGMVVAGTTAPVCNADEAYPHGEGFRTFAERRDAVCVRVGEAAQPVRTCAVLDSPVDEFAFVTDAVAQRLEEGMDPSDVLVAVPNKTWASQIASALERRGVAVCVDAGPAKIKGDPRTPGAFSHMKLAAFLRLHANPNDLPALRSWLGFGDWLLRSDAFLELMAYARNHETTVPQAIADLRRVPDAERASEVFGKLDAPLDELAALQDACRSGLTRDQAVTLFESAGMLLTPAQQALLGDDPNHADIDGLAASAFGGPVRSGDGAGVVVAPYRRCHGRFSRATFVTGLVGGFLPALDAVDDKFTIDHRRAALERERALFEDVAATAQDQTVCTWFKRDLLENTASLNMQTGRVFVKDDVRYATLVPSEFVSGLAS
ncbi:MAG: hypothetical protein PEGG_00996 [Paraeggerthella hongkongensis]|uniref:hypothetical protein n=1 Tax=Paraeggerthella sp. TaxID=2897350 RepID=UPI0030E48E81